MRRALLIFVAVVFLVPLVALAVVLVPAHVQVRQIDPSLPETWALLEAVSVPDAPTRLRYVNSASQPTADGRKMGHPAFVLDWKDGRRFVIDVGMEPETALEFGEPLKTLLGAGEVEPHGSVAQQMGDEVTGIAGIAFTHLHHDHTQGIVTLCRAFRRTQELALPIYQTPYQFEQRNHTTDMGFAFIEEALRLPDSTGCGTPMRLDKGPRESIHPIPGFPGLVAIPAGGHTPGSTLFLTRVGERFWLFSGDITNTRQELVENLGKSALYSLLIVPENTDRTELMRIWLRSLDAREDLVVVVSHDLVALEESGIEAWSVAD